MKNALRKLVAWGLRKKVRRPWNEKVDGPEPKVIINGKVQPKGGWNVIDGNKERAAAITLFHAGMSIVEISNKLVCPPSMIAEYLGQVSRRV